MTPIGKIINYVRGLFEPNVKWNEIDTSCLVFSDHPVVGKGWTKGWVHTRNSIVVAAHANTPEGRVVYVMVGTEKIERTVTKVFSNASTDIALCMINEPFPETVAVYEVATEIKNLQKAATFHKDRTFSLRRIKANGKMIAGRYASRAVIPGDSGLPWFIWDGKKFRVVTHSHFGGNGRGPNYSMGLISVPE